MIRAGQKRLMKAFIATFDTPSGQIVLQHLHNVLGAASDIKETEPIVVGKMIGKRWAWLEIQHYLNLNPQALQRLAQNQENQRDE